MASVGFWSIAQESPERTAVISAAGEEQTFGQLFERVNQISHGLRALGIKKGGAVAIVMSNVPEYLEVFLATQQIGAYITPINYHLTGPEMSYILDNCGAEVFVVAEKFSDAAKKAVNELDYDISKCYSVGNIEGFQPYEKLFEGQSGDLPENRAAGQLMLYTSGTTGRPKGVRRPLEDNDPDATAMMSTLMGALFDLKAHEGVHMVTGPLYHAAPGGFGTGGLHMGHTLVLVEKWDPQECLELIEKHKVTVSHMVPTMFYRCLNLPEDVKQKHDLSSLECIIHGAAPIAIDKKKAIIDWWGPVLVEYYGATEGGGAICKSAQWLEKPGTVGQAWPGSKIVILDDDKNELPANEAGTVFMSSMIGEFEYYKDKAKTDKNRAPGGLFTVGDVGYLDDEGWLYLCDRDSDLIISGGVNIYPAEVEKTLILHNKIEDVAVFGVPNEDFGESVQAVVQLKLGVERSDALKEELLDFAKERLAKFKLPRGMDFADSLPRLDTGKLYKRFLKETYKEAYEKKMSVAELDEVLEAEEALED